MSNNLIAYDLDGILLPDFIYRSENFHISQEARTKLFKPIFKPVSPYVIITGRPKEDEPLTLKWFETFFKKEERPINIYHDNDNIENPWIYKAAVIIQNPKISLMIESNKLQAKFIAKNTKIPVIHFESLLHSFLSPEYLATIVG